GQFPDHGADQRVDGRRGVLRSGRAAACRGEDAVNGLSPELIHSPSLRVARPNHHPFALPAPHRPLKLGSLDGTDLGDYLHSVHYFDEAFGQFVDRLRATRLLDESVVVVYGDHKGYLADERQLATLLGLSSSRPEDL